MDEKDEKRQIDLDTILIEEVGQFGKFQLRTFLLALVLAVFSSWSTSEYVFTTARISSRCKIPECDGDQVEWTPYWLSNAVPTTGESSFDNCQRFGNTTAVLRTVDSDTCPSTLFDRDTLQSCNGYVYEETNTIVYEFDLACKEWERSMIGTIRILGSLISYVIAGYISDRWGRRVALCITATNIAILGILKFWANSYTAFVINQFVESAMGSACYTCTYILVLELTGPKYRQIASASMHSFFAVGSVLLGLIAWAVPYWRHLILALYIPQFLTLSYFWLMFESVRWYMSKGRFDDSEALLRKAAKINGRQVLEKSLAALRQNAEEAARKEAAMKDNADNEWLVVTVFRYKRVLLCCLVAPIWWITSTMIYYGLSINAVNMTGNSYLNYSAVCAAEIPGFWISMFLINKIGRKPVLIMAFWTCAACQIAYIFIPQDMYGLSLAVYLIAKSCNAIEAVGIYIYTAELYPTVKRQSLFNYTSMVGRIGNMVAPLTPAMGAQWFAKLPFALFACMGLLSGSLIFLTPETFGTKLPDTFEQADNLGLKEKKSAK